MVGDPVARPHLNDYKEPRVPSATGDSIERGPELQGAGVGVPMDSAAAAERQQRGAAGDAARPALQGQPLPVRPPRVAAAPSRQVAAALGCRLRLAPRRQGFPGCAASFNVLEGS